MFAYMTTETVRVVSNEATRDLEVQEKVNGEWVRRQSFNEMSDDYAYTNARDAFNWYVEHPTKTE